MSIVNSFKQKNNDIKLNNVIEEFKYVYRDTEVTAGDFVEFIEGFANTENYGISTDTQISAQKYSGFTISATQIDDNRVFIAHSYNTVDNLYGVVCTIEGTNITYGADTLLVDTGTGYIQAGYKISTCLLHSGDVFLVHCRDSNSEYTLYATVIHIEGTIITMGEDVRISDAAYSAYTPMSLCLLPNGDIFITHCYNSKYYLYGRLCSVSGNTVSLKTSIYIDSTQYTGYSTSMCLLSDGNIFLAHSYSSAYRLYNCLISIEGTSFYRSTCWSTASDYNGFKISTLALPDNRVLVAHTNSSYNLNAFVAKVVGGIRIVGTDVQLAAVNTRYCIKTLQLRNGDVFIAFCNAYTSLNGIICTTEDMAVIGGENIILDNSSAAGFEISSLLLSNNTIFIAHSHTQNTWELYAQIFSVVNNIPTNQVLGTFYEQQVMPTTKKYADAIALSSGEGGVEYAEQQVETIKTGNIFPTSWTQVTGTQYTSNGWEIQANSITSNSYHVVRAFDNSTGTWWRPADSSAESWVQIKSPNGIKIKKVKIMCYDGGQDYTLSGRFQASFNGVNWIDVSPFSATSSQTDYQEIEFTNMDYYLYYRLKIGGFYGTVGLHEWQTTEYVEKEMKKLPGEHKDQVKIARKGIEVEKDILHTGNIFPTSGWNEEVVGTKYSNTDGWVIEGDTYYSATGQVYQAFDGNTNTTWASSGITDGHSYDTWIKVTCPRPTKITKVSFGISIPSGYETANLVKATIQGSYDGETWYDLGASTTPQTLGELIEIVLGNTDYYNYYRLYIDGKYADSRFFVSEWQSTEYAEKVVEIV